MLMEKCRAIRGIIYDVYCVLGDDRGPTRRARAERAIEMMEAALLALEGARRMLELNCDEEE